MATDYYPLGMAIPERQWYTGSDSSNYRYGFGGHEKDNEVKGGGNWYTFGDYGYDPRIGRRPSPDPYSYKFPDQSPYSFAANNPIFWIDQDGKEIVPSKAFQDNTRATSVFNQLNKTATFSATTKKFDGPRPIVHLYLDVQNFGSRPNAQTSPRGASPYPFSIAITFNSSYLLNASDVAIARTLLHESIHAKLLQQIESVGGKITKENFPGIYDYYIRHKDSPRGWPHEVMAQHFRGEIIQGLKEFDALNSVTDRSGSILVGDKTVDYTSDQFYEAMSWGGLHGTTAWNNLSEDQRGLYSAIIHQEAGGTDTEMIELPEIIVTPDKE